MSTIEKLWKRTQIDCEIAECNENISSYVNENNSHKSSQECMNNMYKIEMLTSYVEYLNQKLVSIIDVNIN